MLKYRVYISAVLLLADKMQYMHPNTLSTYWEIQWLCDKYMWCLSSIAILRRLILCLRDKNYISDKVRHWFQTVLWWNSFTFLVCFVHLIQRNLNTSHMFAVCIPEGFLFLSGCSACLRMDGGMWMLILLIPTCDTTLYLLMENHLRNCCRRERGGSTASANWSSTLILFSSAS